MENLGSLAGVEFWVKGVNGMGANSQKVILLL